MDKITKTSLIAILLAGLLCPMASLDAKDKKSAKEAKQSATSTVVESSSNQNQDNYSWKGYPANAKTPSETKLLIEREVPKNVRPGEEFTYEIKVTNRSYYPIDGVTLTEKLPSDFKLNKTSLRPEARGDTLKWNIGMMAPGQTEVIAIIGKSTNAGKLFLSGNAVVHYKLPRMVAMMKVIEPVLQFSVEAPEKVIIGQTIPVTMRLRNVGSAPVIGAVLDHKLCKGIVNIDGTDRVAINIGDIMTNENKVFNLKMKAIQVGSFENTFVVKAKDGVTASDTMKTFVSRPKLQMTAKAPRKRFVSNFVKYDINIKNIGDGIAWNSVTRLMLPSGSQFKSANEGGKVENNAVVWRFESLEPGETKELVAQFLATKITTATTVVESTADAAEPVKATLSTSLEGIPAILINLADINDPVPVGERETYIIKVSNQGSLAATGIVVHCDLEDNMKYVKSSGPTKLKSKEGNVLTFEPLTSLKPKEEAQWVVVIQAMKEGDVRFTSRVTCDQLTSEVKEEESTNFYK